MLMQISMIEGKENDVIDVEQNNIPKNNPIIENFLKDSIPSFNGFQMHYPCLVSLKGDDHFERVVIIKKSEVHSLEVEYFERNSINSKDVVAISEAPYRLPVNLANKLYIIGETGMGYFAYIIVLGDGEKLLCKTGNVIDFPALSPEDLKKGVVDAYAGPSYVELQKICDREIKGLDYKWCLI